MLHVIFTVLLGSALLVSVIRGQGDAVTGAMLSAAGEAVTLAINLAGGFAVFCGLMEILRRAGAVRALSARLSRPLRALLGRGITDDALEAVTLNLTANMLGLGNAATPMGLKAMELMKNGARASDAVCLFLVINASSVQLMPTTVIALRASAGSAVPGAVVLPTLAATALSTLVGILACKLLEKRT